jgi:hypothetical protein
MPNVMPSKKLPAAVKEVNLAGSNQIIVDPANPLVINSPKVEYPDVLIKPGGEIQTTVTTSVTFDKLTKNTSRKD